MTFQSLDPVSQERLMVVNIIFHDGCCIRTTGRIIIQRAINGSGNIYMHRLQSRGQIVCCFCVGELLPGQVRFSNQQPILKIRHRC